MMLEEYTCELFHCGHDLIYLKTRKRNIKDARHICMSVMRDFTDATLQEIGEYFNCHHSTVLFALKAVKNLYATNKEYRRRVDLIYTACSAKMVDIPYGAKHDICDYLDEDCKLYASLV